MQILRLISVLVVMTLLGCAAVGSTNATKLSHRPNLITAEEIHLSTANQAYDLIRALRPQWLRGRGYKSLQNPAEVYVNEIRYGDINSLSTITKEMIKEIKFLNIGEATVRFGPNHSSGAILITI
ncbi:MAG: hypothetical protein ACE5G1_03820 [bacterium]